jgi:rhodanese-related sulfurtransferase/peroxiredoxin
MASNIAAGYPSRMQFAIPLLRRSAPLPTGTPAPELSLTADDGAWVRLDDYVDRTVVIGFIGDLRNDQPLRALEALRPMIEGRPGRLFAVSQARPDALRAVRAALHLGYPLLYDLGAWASRGWHQSGLRPYVRDGFAVVQGGRVAHHHVGLWAVDDLRGALHAEADGGPGEAADALDWSSADAWMSEGVPLIDVRTPDEFAAIHHPTAKNVPLDELPARISEIGRPSRVLVVCQTGGRSENAVSFLRSSGIADARNVKGGMNAWSGRG